MAQLRASAYRFREQRRVFSQGEEKKIWTAQDALVLKALTLVLQDVLQPQLSGRCYHLAGTGGLKGAVRLTVERFFERVSRLYEQNATASRIEEYPRRWWRWVRSGVGRVELGRVGEGVIALFFLEIVFYINHYTHMEGNHSPRPGSLRLS